MRRIEPSKRSQHCVTHLHRRHCAAQIRRPGAIAQRPRHRRLDPIRLIEAVTAGVAFLAAGTIIFSRGKVKGLTTGAGMWLAGAIGLASGLGFWQIAGLATLLALVVLMVLHRIEKSFVDHREGGRGDAS